MTNPEIEQGIAEGLVAELGALSEVKVAWPWKDSEPRYIIKFDDRDYHIHLCKDGVVSLYKSYPRAGHAFWDLADPDMLQKLADFIRACW